MTREETATIIEIMQWFRDGAEVEERLNPARTAFPHPWVRAANPAWDWDTYEYRLALPEKLEVWLDVFGHVVRLIRDKDDIADHPSHRRVTLVVKEEKE